MKKNKAKKNRDYYLNLNYPIRALEDETGGWVFDIPDLPGCITAAEKFEDGYEAINLVKEGWIDLMLEEGREIPIPSAQKEFSGKFSLRIPRSLHQRLARQATGEGMSLNNFCTYLLSLGSGLKEKEPARSVTRPLRKAANRVRRQGGSRAE